jgi:hypothetical protein
MTVFLVIVQLKGQSTETLKGHIVPKRISANNAKEAVDLATKGKIYEEEGFEIISVQAL